MKTPPYMNRLKATAAAAVFVICFSGFGSALFAQSKGVQTPKPRATFDKVWIDYDVTDTGRSGMRVHAAFSLYQLKGKDCVLMFTFHDAEGPLLDLNGQYANKGDVAISRQLKPAYDPAVYEDLDAFIPYEEFELEDGKYSLKIDIDINYPNGELIQHLGWKDFEYTQRANNSKTSNVGVELISKSVDYDVTRNGARGMLLHVTIDSVTGLKGVDSAIQVRIQDAKNNFVLGDTPEFSDASGNFLARFEMKPMYDPAKFEDATIFIPYSEISVGKGAHKLKLDIDLVYENGDFISHLAFHDFDFKR